MLLFGIIAISVLVLTLLYFESMKYEDMESRRTVVQTGALISMVMSALSLSTGFVIYLLNKTSANGEVTENIFKLAPYVIFAIVLFAYACYLFSLDETKVNQLIDKRKKKFKK